MTTIGHWFLLIERSQLLWCNGHLYTERLRLRVNELPFKIVKVQTINHDANYFKPKERPLASAPRVFLFRDFCVSPFLCGASHFAHIADGFNCTDMHGRQKEYFQRSHQEIFPKFFQGGPKVGKFSFSHSKLRKYHFLPNFSKSKEGLAPPSHAHADIRSLIMRWSSYHSLRSLERSGCSLLAYSYWPRQIDFSLWQDTVQRLRDLCSCTQLFSFLSILNLPKHRAWIAEVIANWLYSSLWGVAPCIWITRLRVCITLPRFNYCRTTICDRRICSAMVPERPVKDWHARNQIGPPGEAKSFARGPKSFELCPIFLNWIQHIFPEGWKCF